MRGTRLAGYSLCVRFHFIDEILERTDARIVTLKRVAPGEDYLQDHFPTFPVLPGVLMIEAMVQAARRLLAARDPSLSRHVLGQVRALKYGTFVRPGDTMRIDVALLKQDAGGAFEFRGAGEVIRAGGPTSGRSGEPLPGCVSGRFALRPCRIGG